MTIEEVRHDYLGAEWGGAFCCDRACHSRTVGIKSLFEYHHGYGEEAPKQTPQEREKLFDACNKHDQSHRMKIIIGHGEIIMDEAKGVSVTIYENIDGTGNQ